MGVDSTVLFPGRPVAFEHSIAPIPCKPGPNTPGPWKPGESGTGSVPRKLHRGDVGFADALPNLFIVSGNPACSREQQHSIACKAQSEPLLISACEDADRPATCAFNLQF